MMRTAVLRSVIWFSERDPVRRVPFLLDPGTVRDPSFFEVDAEIHGTRYTYGFELDDTRVRGEWLHAYPRGRRQVWFDRDYEGVVTFPGEGLRGDKLDLARRTRHDSLFQPWRDPQPRANGSSLRMVPRHAPADYPRKAGPRPADAVG